MIKNAYYGLSLLMILLVFLGVIQAAKRGGYNSRGILSLTLTIAVGFTAWINYLWFIAGSEIILDKGLPPKMLLLVVLPITGFCIYFFRTQSKAAVVRNMPRTWPVYVQSFRILVEILILYTFKEGVMPKSATFEGYNFDIVMGILAVPVGLWLFRGEVKRPLLMKLWNIGGIMMILWVALIIVSSYLKPLELWGSEHALVDPAFFDFPYLLLAGVLAPLGIFFHVFSLTQHRQLKD